MSLLRIGVGAGVIVGMVFVSLVAGPVTAAPAGSDERVLLVTAPPYLDVSTLERALVDAGWEVVTVCLDGSFASGVRSLEQLTADPEGFDVVAVGAAALPVRWWLEREGRGFVAANLVLVAPTGAGSVAADALYAEQLAARVERYRSERDMYRTEEAPRWARPEYVGLKHYVAQRSRDLFEPLYGSYLTSQHMSLLPAGLEGAVGFLGWASARYPARLPTYLTDAGVPVSWDGTLAELELGEPGRFLSWGYVDLLSALTARRTYLTMVPATRVLGEDLLLDVPVGPDWKTMLIEFARRRALRFVRDYIMPNLANRGRQEALGWLEQQLDLGEEVLLYQLPRWVTVPGPEGPLEIPANQLIGRIDSPGGGAGESGTASAVLATAPNWWQIFNPHIGPNDWWTEAQSARSGVAGDVVELFTTVGGRAGRDEDIAAAAVELLGGGAHGPQPSAVMDLLGRFADAILSLATRLRYPGLAGADAQDLKGDRRDEQTGVGPGDVEEEIPEIRATYRNKSTTLKTERRISHAAWAWDFGDEGERLDADPANLSGEVAHTYREAGQYEVTARSLAADGTALVEGQWSVAVPSEGWTEVFPYDTARELIPEITLSGPAAWVVGRPARYRVEVELDPVPGPVENLQIVIYPAEEFDVVWERPGTFQVTGAVNLRYSWRRVDGSSRYFSVIFTEERPVQVLATSLTGR